MASLEDIGLVNQDDDEELRAKAIEALASPKQISPSDLDVSQAETSPVGSALLKKYLVDPRKQAEADDTYMRNQMLVGGLRNFLSPKSGEANLKVAENTPNPQDRLKSYADLLSKVQAASKGERESEYLNQEISPALRAHYDSLKIPLPEKATYGSLAATEKANKPIFDSLRDKNKLEQMKQILDYKAQVEQGNKAAEANRELNKTKRLSPEELLKVKQGEDAIRIADELITGLDKSSGLGGPLKGAFQGANPYDTAAQDYQADLEKRAQVIGLFLEGGKLQKADEEKYKRMLPKLTDTPEVRKTKAAQVRQLLVEKQKGVLSGLQGQNYSLEGVKTNFDQAPETKIIKGVPHAKNPKDGLWYPVEN